MPAHANGVYGLKPSSEIIPFSGQAFPVAPGTPIFNPLAGPLAKPMRECGYFLQTVMRAESWTRDADCLHVPWVGNNLNLSLQKLRIGVASDDGLFTPTPPIQSALEESTKKLQAAEHTIIPITFPIFGEVMNAVMQFFTADNLEFAKAQIAASGEPIIPSVANAGFLRPGGQPITLQALMPLLATRHVHQQVYTDFWRDNKLDVILMPTAPHTAIPHDLWSVISYTVLWNYLDHPAVSIPYGRVGKEHIKSTAKYGAADDAYHGLYSGPDEYAGLPTSVQVVGYKQDDESFVQISAIIDQIIHSKRL